MAQEQTTGERNPGGRNAAALFRWLNEHRLDLAILVALAAVAGSVRLPMLAEIPAGLHGDEAWTGIDAVRVLEEGWIGPYVTSALGQASGPIYVAAPFVGLFGETVFSIRLAGAVMGIATVLVAYLAFRVMFDRTVAVFGAVLLAVGVWHLHYSRLAFPVIAWPLLEVLTLLFLFLAIKSGRWLHYALAGLFAGAGVYTYNAYPVFALPVALFVGWIALGLALARERRAELLRRYAARVALMAGVALLAALPLILYVTDSSNEYFNHQQTISLFEQSEWQEAGTWDRAELLKDKAWDFYRAAFWSGDPDEADGAGQQAMVDRVSLVLLIAGVFVLLVRWRRPASVAVLLLVLLVPLGTFVTIQGTYRQTLGVVPFLALLAAIPLALWWQQSARFVPRLRYASYAVIVGVVGLISFLNLFFYFDDFPDSELARTTFSPELTETVEFITDLPDGGVVYFYSDRWSFDYEVIRYLAADRAGEDRSTVFGEFSLEPDPSQNVAYVFMDPYKERLSDAATRFPGGREVDGGGSYLAYLLPRSQAPAPTPTAVSAAEAMRQRDVARMQDLEEIQQTIAVYTAEGNALPNTNGDLQSLCVFRELDAGCELLEVLDQLPEDPLGDAGVNGYFYVSDGATYIVYAQRETDAFPACDEHPEFLGQFDALLCVKGP
ncbi:MAG: glycosyltransferase family 39 protein [Chloroflexi bacterium]|nr:glycosyltransferase family 39 protein [Chloroflexota bacterium]